MTFSPRKEKLIHSSSAFLWSYNIVMLYRTPFGYEHITVNWMNAEKLLSTHLIHVYTYLMHFIHNGVQI